MWEGCNIGDGRSFGLKYSQRVVGLLVQGVVWIYYIEAKMFASWEVFLLFVWCYCGVFLCFGIKCGK